jgi:hypothetical protein
MQITIEYPPTIPARPEQVFPGAWYASIGIIADPRDLALNQSGESRVTIVKRAMNDAGELHPDWRQEISTTDLAAAIKEVPEVAAAMTANIAAAVALEAWLAQRSSGQE